MTPDAAADSPDDSDRVVITPVGRTRMAMCIFVVVILLLALGGGTALAASVTRERPFVIGLCASVALAAATVAVATFVNLRRPVVCTRAGIEGLRITPGPPPPNRVWRARYVYHPAVVPWQWIVGYRVLRIRRATQGTSQVSFPVIIELVDGRMARTGFAAASMSRAQRTVATLRALQARWGGDREPSVTDSGDGVA